MNVSIFIFLLFFLSSISSIIYSVHKGIELKRFERDLYELLKYQKKFETVPTFETTYTTSKLPWVASVDNINDYLQNEDETL